MNGWFWERGGGRKESEERELYYRAKGFTMMEIYIKMEIEFCE